MELKNFSSELQPLTFEQANEINGGETAWYWIFYVIGGTMRGVSDDLHNASHNKYHQSAGSKAMHSALG